MDGSVRPWDQPAFRRLPACSSLPYLAPNGSPAWDYVSKPGTDEANYNYADRLVVSGKWTEMMSLVVIGDPLQLVKMALVPPKGPMYSGLRYYLARSENYELVTPLQTIVPAASVLVPLSYLFAPSLWFLLLISSIQAGFSRKSWLRGVPAYWFALGLLCFHLIASTLLEYGENMRFRAEIDSVLLAAGVMALFSLTRRKSKLIAVGVDSSPP